MLRVGVKNLVLNGSKVNGFFNENFIYVWFIWENAHAQLNFLKLRLKKIVLQLLFFSIYSFTSMHEFVIFVFDSP